MKKAEMCGKFFSETHLLNREGNLSGVYKKLREIFLWNASIV